MTADEYKAWFRKVKTPCVLYEGDYMYQVGVGVSAVPTLGTFKYSNVPYVDEESDPPVEYDAVLLKVPTFERSLSRDTLRGRVAVNISGGFVLNNRDQRQNRVLYLALDGSDGRVYIGDPTWDRSDFLHLYTVVQAKASTTSNQHVVEIAAGGVELLLNKRIGGTVAVGGTGPNAEKYRPLPFGYVHNMEPLLIQTSPSFKYAYADRGTNASVPIVRDNGAVLTVTTDYVDNADGTFTLVNNPQGDQITCDVLLYPAGGANVDYRISDALEFFIGGEAGLTAAGKFDGAHASYFDSGVTDNPVNDYFCQKLLTESTNGIEILDDLLDTANGFSAQYRTGEFYYGRMRPEALSTIIALSGGRLTVAAEIGQDDIIKDTIKVDHRVPTYASYQCLTNLNQTKQNTFAGSLTADERAMLSRDGLPNAAFFGEEVGSTQYLGAMAGEPYKGGAPELYDLLLHDSQIVRTLISGPDDTSAPDPIGDPALTMAEMAGDFVSVRRSQFLPWTEFVDFDTFLEFYELEIGDIPNLTYPNFDLDGGALHQVYRIGFDPMIARMSLGLVRRRFAGISGPLSGTNRELREDGGFELREDGGKELRE